MNAEWSGRRSTPWYSGMGHRAVGTTMDPMTMASRTAEPTSSPWGARPLRRTTARMATEATAPATRAPTMIHALGRPATSWSPRWRES